MRTQILVTAAAMALAISCNRSVSYSSSSTPPTDASAQGEGKPIPKPESEQAQAANTGKVVEPKNDPKAAQRKEFEKAMQELEAEHAKEVARWTPEIKEAAAKLTARKWRSTQVAMKAILASPHRQPKSAARDQYRHPTETLGFFGIKPNMTVFEFSPGGGWWTELLAPLLAASGKLRVASFDSKSDDLTTAYFGRVVELLIARSGELFGKVEVVPNATLDAYDMGPAESVDAIMVMRMTHNLVQSGGLDKFLVKAHETLKPGGVLAIEQHRAPEGADVKETSKRGYVPEAWLIQTVEAAGFKLEKKSEINANAKDTKDYKEGVWALPPTLAAGETDKAKFEAIGESDRMTLKFIKPKAKKTATGAGAATDVKGLTPPSRRQEGGAGKSAVGAEAGKVVAPTK